MHQLIKAQLFLSLRRTIKYQESSHKNNSDSDTIYGLGTGLGGAINIIRISGPNSYKSLELLNKDRSQYNEQKLANIFSRYRSKPRYAFLRKFYNRSSKIIDQGLVLYFPKQNSYNKQDIFQFHLHGSKAVAASIIKQFDLLGMRMAQRGQFTKRAVTNGRLTIFQAQAINDLVKSQTEFSRQVAINHLLGKSKDFLENIKKDLVSYLSKNQAYIDFQQQESDVKQTLFEETKKNCINLMKKIQTILSNYKNVQMIGDGINIGIYGKTNVGKSTLINKLSQRQVSIVSQQHGTTRDIIQATIEVSGCKVNLYDTAGLRDQVQSTIEAEGIKRAKKLISQNHFNILVIDWKQEEIEINNDRMVIKMKDNKTPKVIYIVNKIDLLPENIKSIEIEVDGKTAQLISISAENQKGLEEIKKRISQNIQTDFKIYQNTEEIFFTRKRYFDQLNQCINSLQNYIHQNRPEIACQELRNAIKAIQCIYGRVDNQEVLDVLFRDFCIGK